MPLNLTKKPEDATQSAALADEVEEFAKLLAWEAKQKKNPNVVRLKALKDKFQKLANETAEDQDHEVTFQGTTQEVIYGANSRDRFVENREKLIEFVGLETALEIATFGVTKVDDLLTGAQKKEVFGVNRGNRTPKTQPLSTKPEHTA